MIELDGNFLEGGGQIVRTALALSMITQRPFRVKNIRAGRPTPGLKQQHLMGIKTLIDFSGSRCDGAELGSEEITFYPKPFLAKKAELDMQTAGSITLLLQTLFLPMMLAKKKTTLEITGGTDVAWSPQIDYLLRVVTPHLQKYAKVEVARLKRGYYPKGNGKVTVSVKPLFSLDNLSLAPRIELVERGKLMHIKGVSHCSLDLEPSRVAERQAKSAEFNLSRLGVPVNIAIETHNTSSTGSGITCWAIYQHAGEVNHTNPQILGSDSLGDKGFKAEEVGTLCAQRLLEDVQSGALVDRYLADHLIPFLGIFGGKMHVARISKHTLTNIYVTKQFLNISIDVNEETGIISVEQPYDATTQATLI